MVKTLFICHGNICRNPMAEFVMKDMVIGASYTVAGFDGASVELPITLQPTSNSARGEVE